MKKRPRLPVFGICLGHQILGRTLGLATEKLSFGHHGANHPVLEVESGRVLITSQNHNFCIQNQDLPDNLTLTHKSLFDDTNQGICFADERPVFSVQFPPRSLARSARRTGAICQVYGDRAGGARRASVKRAVRRDKRNAKTNRYRKRARAGGGSDCHRAGVRV